MALSFGVRCTAHQFFQAFAASRPKGLVHKQLNYFDEVRLSETLSTLATIVILFCTHRCSTEHLTNAVVAAVGDEKVTCVIQRQEVRPVEARFRGGAVIP